MDFVVPVETTGDPEKPYECKFPGCTATAFWWVWGKANRKAPYCEHHKKAVLGLSHALREPVSAEPILQLLETEDTDS